jgi:glutamyl-tRNA reductase
MIFARCSLIKIAKKSARETTWLLQYQEICKQPSYSFRRYVHKETDLKIHAERSNSIRLCSNFDMGSETVLPKQAQVVICGAGTVANSVAYHLVQNGWNDILVLEQKK